jgi:hypothetical protein
MACFSIKTNNLTIYLEIDRFLQLDCWVIFLPLKRLIMLC